MNINTKKLAQSQEAAGWLKQAEIYYKALRYEIGDDCVKKAKAALDDEVFKRQPIPGFSRHEQPETLWVRNPVTNGKMLINGSDFDPQQHQIWEELPPTSSKRK
jgi:hypothetical protein